MKITSFPPVISEHSKVLVLGTMPGQRSLEIGEYYASPRNQFWCFMNEICGAGPELSYRDRIAKGRRQVELPWWRCN